MVSYVTYYFINKNHDHEVGLPVGGMFRKRILQIRQYMLRNMILSKGVISVNFFLAACLAEL